MCYRRRGEEGRGREEEKEKKKKKGSVTWRLFSLSARALLGAVVPAEEEEAGAGSRPPAFGVLRAWRLAPHPVRLMPFPNSFFSFVSNTAMSDT